MDRIFRLLSEIYKTTDRHRNTILGLSVVVVFVSTYLLILPAFTLEKNEAAKQGGISVQGIEAVSEDAGQAQDGKAGSITGDDGNTSANSTNIGAGNSGTDNQDNQTGNGSGDQDSAIDSQKVDGSGSLVYEGDGYDVTIEDTNGVLPEGTSLDVREISADRKRDAREYRELSDLAADALRSEKIIGEKDEVRFARLYDITLSADGQEVEPAGDECVGIRISYDRQMQKELAVEDADNVHIVHFAEDPETGEIITEIYDSRDVDITVKRDRLAETAFAAESFSVYAVVYTVDFHWEVDGKMYDFSLPGGGFVSFTDLVEVLGIAISDNNEYDDPTQAAKSFVADVENIEFSNPELVWVGKTEADTTLGRLKQTHGLECEYSQELMNEDISHINDAQVEGGEWILVSLKPFMSEETLTVTMQNGDQFTVRVTDAQIKKAVISASGETYEITVTYGEDAQIPNGAELKVEEILPEDERYEEYYQKSLEKVGVSAPEEDASEEKETVAGVIDNVIESLTDLLVTSDIEEEEEAAKTTASDYARIYDIEIWADGKKIEPKADVTVNIKLLDAPEEESVSPQVVHFAEDGLELMDIAEKAENRTDDSIQFVTDEFSVYSVVYTVDFFYNGYAFSIKGDTAVSLMELAKQLHIVEEKSDENTLDESSNNTESAFKVTETNADPVFNDMDKFIQTIDTVEFSDSSLVFVAYVDKDATLGEIKENNDIYQDPDTWLLEDNFVKFNSVMFKANDWAIISLKPFLTDEKLIIKLKTGQQIVIDVTDEQNAVMKADGTVQTISNPGNTTITMFDYWMYNGWDGYNNINQDTKGRLAWPGGWHTTSSGWDWTVHTPSSGYPYLVGTGNDSGINQGHNFKFRPASWHNVYDGTLGTLEENGTPANPIYRINSWTGSANPTQGLFLRQLYDKNGNPTTSGLTGYPKLTTDSTLGTDGESLAYLFDTTNQQNKDYKASYSADQLLYVDPDGYYTFDSWDYNAKFNKQTGTFTLTEQDPNETSTEKRSFWPFGDMNYWFGMHINTEFSIPYGTDSNPKQVLNPKGKYNDMVFEFGGDDDALVYIDGVLVGDGGGVHNKTKIFINFTTGDVLVTGKEDPDPSRVGTFEQKTTIKEMFEKAGVADKYEWEGNTFKAGTYHNFDFFYLERGGGESNLYLHYNLISTTDFTGHKAMEGLSPDERMLRDQFQFELIGLDGRYNLQNELVDNNAKALMPKEGSASGSGKVDSPKLVQGEYTLSNGTTVGSQIYTTGVTEDGNINFGTLELPVNAPKDMVYRYVIREVPKEKTEKVDGVDYEKLTFDDRIYYMEISIDYWTDSANVSHPYLKKTYYTDDTYTVMDDETNFISFLNEKIEPLDLKIIKKNQTQTKNLSGAEFSLIKAKKIEEVDEKTEAKTIKWLALDDAMPTTGTTDGSGTLTFEDLTAGSYILTETNPPTGYKVADTSKWLLTLTKEEVTVGSGDNAYKEIRLNPTITALHEDGTVSGASESLTVDRTNNIFEYLILNGKIPVGDITVEKKWLKVDGTSTYTDAELEVLGVAGTKITGELWRKGEIGTTNPTVTIYAKSSTGKPEYGDPLASVTVKSGTDLEFAVCPNNNSTTFPEIVVTPSAQVTYSTEANVVYTGAYSTTKSGNSNVFKVSSVTSNLIIYANFGEKDFNGNTVTKANIGQATAFGIYTRYTEGGNSTATSVDEKFAEFTLQKGAWSKTWLATELYGADQDEDWSYYFKNVTESPALADFKFTANPEVNVVGTKTTYTYKNIYQKVSVKIIKVIKDTETPLAGA